MTLFLDADYIRLTPILKAQCQARDIPFEVTDLNTQGWGDVMYTGIDGVHSGEIKGAGEILSSLDRVEAQLGRQLPNTDHAFLGIYGHSEMAPDGNTYALEPDGRDVATWDRHPDSGVRRSLKRRYFRQNYLGFRSKLARFSQLGIEVFEVPSLEMLAVQLVALYDIAQTEGSTFKRLIKEKPFLPELTPNRRFALTLMGLDGVGEEVALAIAGQCSSVVKLINWLVEEPEFVSRWPLRSGKRTIGPAAVQRLKQALGVES